MPSPTRGREDSVLDQAQLAAAPGAADAASQVAAAPRPRAGQPPGERTPSHDPGAATRTRTAAVPTPIDGNRTVGHDSEGDRATAQEPHTDKSADRPADKQADKQADKPADKPADKQADKPAASHRNPTNPPPTPPSTSSGTTSSAPATSVSASA